jgi:hypothetical protein
MHEEGAHSGAQGTSVSELYQITWEMMVVEAGVAPTDV